MSPPYPIRRYLGCDARDDPHSNYGEGPPPFVLDLATSAPQPVILISNHQVRTYDCRTLSARGIAWQSAQPLQPASRFRRIHRLASWRRLHRCFLPMRPLHVVMMEWIRHQRCEQTHTALEVVGFAEPKNFQKFGAVATAHSAVGMALRAGVGLFREVYVGTSDRLRLRLRLRRRRLHPVDPSSLLPTRRLPVARSRRLTHHEPPSPSQSPNT